MTKQLNIYDFDGTLVNTPSIYEAFYYYKEVLNKPFPYDAKYWWHNPDALLGPLKSIVTPGFAMPKYMRDLKQDNQMTIVLTAKSQECIASVLYYLELYTRNKNIKQVYCKPEKTLDSYQYKTSVINDIITKYPSIEKVNMYDDRKEHVSLFKSWSKENPLLSNKQVQVYEVIAPPCYVPLACNIEYPTRRDFETLALPQE
jgi:hypothetical protein